MICNEGQPFAANYNNSYADSGLKGHTGEDWSCGWATPIKSPYDGIVYKVLTVQNPANDGSGFTGVFMLVDNGLESFEWLIGHCDPTVQIGQQIKAGDVIGTEANHGLVYSGNIEITLAMQRAGDQRGHHRHEQKRPVMKVQATSPQFDYLTIGAETPDGGGPYRDADGHYYQVFDFNNGYNGCVDPSLPCFMRNLTEGDEGYDVFVLQRFLAFHGLLPAEDCIGIFGPKTKAAVATYQAQNNIDPTEGYFGPLTRASVIPNIPSISVVPGV